MPGQHWRGLVIFPNKKPARGGCRAFKKPSKINVRQVTENWPLSVTAESTCLPVPRNACFLRLPLPHDVARAAVMHPGTWHAGVSPLVVVLRSRVVVQGRAGWPFPYHRLGIADGQLIIGLVAVDDPSGGRLLGVQGHTRLRAELRPLGAGHCHRRPLRLDYCRGCHAETASASTTRGRRPSARTRLTSETGISSRVPTFRLSMRPA